MSHVDRIPAELIGAPVDPRRLLDWSDAVAAAVESGELELWYQLADEDSADLRTFWTVDEERTDAEATRDRLAEESSGIAFAAGSDAEPEYMVQLVRPGQQAAIEPDPTPAPGLSCPHCGADWTLTGSLSYSEYYEARLIAPGKVAYQSHTVNSGAVCATCNTEHVEFQEVEAE